MKLPTYTAKRKCESHLEGKPLSFEEWGGNERLEKINLMILEGV